MANTGNVFPGTGENNAGIGATAWSNPGNVVSDNTTDATCSAAASSQYLVARNFGLSVPAGATILGITVQVEASEHSGGTESLNAQLQNDSGTLVGSSQAQTINGTGKAVSTYGSTSDLWGATLTPAIVNDADFGVRLWFTTSHDVRIDYVTLAVEYSEAVAVAPSTGSAAWAGIAPTLAFGILTATGAAAWAGIAPTVAITDHVAVAPATGSAEWAGIAPTVTVEAVGSAHDVLLRVGSAATIAAPVFNQLALPDTGAAAWAGVAPTVAITAHVTAAPSTGAASWAGVAPTVAVTDHTSVAPSTGAAVWTGIAPTVATTNHIAVAPGTGAAAWVGIAPTVLAGAGASPGTGAAAWTGIAPTVAITAHVSVAPGTGAVAWSGIEPTVSASNHITATTSTGAASWAGIAPSADVSAHVWVTPDTGTAVWEGFAPTVSEGSGAPVVFPGTGAAVWTGYAPLILTETPVPQPVLGIPRVDGVAIDGLPSVTGGTIAQGTVGDIALSGGSITLTES